MLLTEYDEKQHMKTVYREGYEEGEQAGKLAGQQELLERQIKKKLEYGKSTVIIAKELELEIETAEELISKIQKEHGSK